jgi:hypothetical protein
VIRRTFGDRGSTVVKVLRYSGGPRERGGEGTALQYGTAVARWLRYCATVGDRGSTVVKVMRCRGGPRWQGG